MYNRGRDDDESGTEDGDGVLDAGDACRVGDISDYANDEQFTGPGVEQDFGCDSTVCAAEHDGKRLLPLANSLRRGSAALIRSVKREFPFSNVSMT